MSWACWGTGQITNLQADFDALVDSTLREHCLDLGYYCGAQDQALLSDHLFLLPHLGDQSEVAWEVVGQDTSYSLASQLIFPIQIYKKNKQEK